MNFFEEYYSDKLPPRLTKLREKYKLTQTSVGNASQVAKLKKESVLLPTQYYTISKQKLD